MWNKKDEVYPQRPAGPRPEPAEPRREMQPPAPAPPTPAPALTKEPPKSLAAIGASMVIVGEIYSREELLVDGEVDGTLELQHRLTIGANGKVRATIKAREVVIFGSVQGNVEVTDKIVIRQNGSLIGDIKASGIVIDDGAYFKGSIDIVKSPPIKVASEKPEAEAKPHAEAKPQPVARQA
jgi:cytoskeletal protein CcmA (bactofilin family)